MVGLLSILLGIIGFVIGIPIGLFLGYFLFIYSEPTDVKDPIIRPVYELDSSSVLDLLPELPLWVKQPEYERIDWLNDFLSDMWPYLDKAICGILRSNVEQNVSEYGSKFFVNSVDFKSLSLGTLPPRVHGIKVCQTNNDNELVLEPAVRWAGNPDITLVLKLFSLPITVQLLDVQISSAPRIVLKPLVPAFPCFANIEVSLMEKPRVDFGLKVVGGDIMAIPGLYQFVQVGTHDKLGMQVVPLRSLAPNETKKLTLNLVKNTNPNDLQNKKNRGQLVVELRFNLFLEDSKKFSGPLDRYVKKESEVGRSFESASLGAGLLLVTVQGAEDVEGKHHNNPFAMVLFRGEVKKTKTIKKSRDPCWNEEFQFVLEEAPLKEKIRIEIKSKQRGIGFRRKELLGYIDINLNDVVYNGRIKEKYHLINSKYGVLHVEMRWKAI